MDTSSKSLNNAAVILVSHGSSLPYAEVSAGPGLVGRGSRRQLLVGDDVLDGAVRGQAE